MRISAGAPAGLWLPMLSAALLLGGVAGAAIDKPDIDKQLAAMADYKQGDSREPLIAVEDLIRGSQSDAEQRKYVETQLAKLLESGTSVDCKQFICRQLWFIGTDESVPAIAKLLTDEQTVDMACYAIGQNPSAAAGKALRDALEKSGPTVRIRIINLLGDRRDAESVAILGKLALGGERDLADAAVAALGKIGGADAREALAQVRTKADERLRLAATDAYLRCAEDLAAEGKADEAVAIYKELAGRDEAQFTRSAAVKGLADVGGRDVVALVVAALKDEDRMVRTTARGCIRTMPGVGVTELFAAQLAGSSPGDQVLLIAALADRGDTAALGAITAAAGSTDAEVRKAALGAVGRLGDASSVGFLIDAARSAGSSDENDIALNNLAILRGADIDDAIVKSMQKADPALRPQLIDVLFERNAVTAVPALLAEAAGGDSKVRRAAFRALGRLAGEKDLPALVSLLAQIKGAGGRADAERAVVAVARKIAEPGRQADAILAALNGEQRVEARCSLLRVLGGVANEKSLEALCDALNDRDAQVRDTAVRTLSDWPNAQAAETLLEIYRETQDQAHRLLSLRGLVRVLSVSAEEYPADQAVEIYRRAMKLVVSPVEKKLVLSGLSNIAHPGSLEMACASLDDEAVKAEAAPAVMKIARAIAGSYRSEARAAAQKVLSATANDVLRRQAEDVIALLKSFGDYITAWQVSGPYSLGGGSYEELFDTDFTPEKGQAGDVKWRLMPAGTDASRPGFLDISARFAGGQKVAYLRTWIHSDKEQPARFELGSDGGAKMWLNETVVYANKAGPTSILGSDKSPSGLAPVDVRLGEGWNSLLVKLVQNGSSWGFQARLQKADGGKLEGARIDCTSR